VVGLEGFVLGKSRTEDDESSPVVEYLVVFRELSQSVKPEDISRTGRRIAREEYYSGDSIRVSVHGDYLGPGIV